jgi:hypothetical protein
VHAQHAPLDVHADVAFTAAERSLLSEATQEIAAQTGIEIRIQFDLDFGRPLSLKAKPQLVRLTSDVERLAWLDRRFGGRVLGLTLWTERRAELVADRLSDGRRFAHVAQHELLHLLGVDDADGGALMGSSMARDPSSTMNESDWAAFAAAGGAR